MRFLGAIAAMAAALAFALAACGSGSEPTDEGAPPTTATHKTIDATTTDSEPEPEPITVAKQR